MPFTHLTVVAKKTSGVALVVVNVAVIWMKSPRIASLGKVAVTMAKISAI